MALRSKLEAWYRHLCFKAENSDFDHFQKMLASCKGLEDGNKTYWVPLCPIAMVFDKRRKIWNRKCFHVEISHFLENFGGHKNPFPCLSLCSRWLILIIYVKLCKIRKIRGSTFGYFALFWFKPNLEDFCLEIQVI